MKLNRRHVLGGLAATPFAGLISAQAQAPVRLSYWHHLTSTTEFKGLERVVALFQQKHPQIGVAQENIPNPEYMSKMTAAVVANARPDTGMVIAERANDLVAMGALTDLTARIRAWPRFGEYPEQAWRGASINGKIYGIPAFTFVDWMYYRKDWFQEAGIAPPARTGPRAVGPVPLTLTAPSQAVRCPHCGAPATEELSRFGPTACTALRRCPSCREPFEHMKEI